MASTVKNGIACLRKGNRHRRAVVCIYHDDVATNSYGGVTNMSVFKLCVRQNFGELVALV